MNLVQIVLVLVTILIIGEFLSRCVYYLRKREYSFLQRVQLVFFGRWLTEEKKSSPLYIKEIAASLNVDTRCMISILSEASGKDTQLLETLFLEKTGIRERHNFSPLLGFIPAPCQDLGHMKTNQWGFRGKEISSKKPINVKRVLLLGGSVAFGRTATSEEMTIASLLEKKLNQISLDGIQQWEVINLAVPDFISIQELYLLVKTGFQFEPDIVISLSGVNDTHHYLLTGVVNEPSSMNNVKNAYDAFFGKPLQRLLIILGSYFVSMDILNHITRIQKHEADEGEISPFIYTIW